jgi:hypothetical protein
MVKGKIHEWQKIATEASAEVYKMHWHPDDLVMSISFRGLHIMAQNADSGFCPSRNDRRREVQYGLLLFLHIDTLFWRIILTGMPE